MKKLGAAVTGYFRRTDKWLLFFWTGASALSVMFLCGLYYRDIQPGEDLPSIVSTHLVASLLGLGAAVLISLFDYRVFLKLWKLYAPLCVLFVLMTFFSAFSSTRGDNQAWLVFQFGSFEQSVQPSEFLKISFITTMSVHIAKVRGHINRLSTVLLLCLHGGAHILLIHQQGDDGTAIIFAAIFAVMLFCAGIGWRYIAAAGVGLAAFVPILWTRILSEDQKMRILVLQNPDLDPSKAYQQTRAINAMGLGGMQGVGLFPESPYYVPEAYNDFIFSFIGQAAGFVGCLGVVVLLMAIAFKILYNSRLATDDQGRFICIGMFAMIVAQIIVNLGMCLGLLPVIGVTLPLFSAGGSSVLSLYIGLGLLLSVYTHPNTSLFESKEGRQ